MDLKDPDHILAGCIHIYDDVIDYSDQIIGTAEKLDRWRQATVFDHDGESRIVRNNIRSNLIFDVNYDKETTQDVFIDMNLMVYDYLSKYSDIYDFSYDYVEPAQILRYEYGQKYEPHYDTGPSCPRVVSALLYLNDVEDGGETEFINFDIKVRPKENRLVIFPSNYAYRHAALPPTDGIKYVTVYWAREIRNE